MTQPRHRGARRVVRCPPPSRIHATTNTAVSDVTDLLARWHRGDPDALDEMMPLVYGELRQLAQHYMRREHSDHTAADSARPRGVPAPGRERSRAVQQPHALLRRRRTSDAPNPRGPRAAAAGA